MTAEEIVETRRTEKRCWNCKEVKTLDLFHRNKNEPDGRCSRCAACVRAHRKNNAAVYRQYKHATNIRVNYGLTVQDWDAMLASQNGSCAICKTTDPGKKKTRLSVDHDHVTGKVRGLLCNRCNRAIGLFGDDAGILDVAAEYLRKPDVH